MGEGEYGAKVSDFAPTLNTHPNPNPNNNASVNVNVSVKMNTQTTEDTGLPQVTRDD
jgi:hypothetical protein